MASTDPQPGKDSVLLLGCSKSGTTGLYTTVKNGFDSAGFHVHAVFEPKRAAELDNLFLFAPAVPVLTKLTMDKVDKALGDPEAFERRIMIIRDPRDIVVSALLFRPLTRRAMARAKGDAVRQFIAALRRKEADPSSISVRQLFDLSQTLGFGSPPFPGMRAQLEQQQKLLREHEFHVVRYEQFVADDLADLSSYLGFAVHNVAEADSSTFGHIVRSRSAGGFRHWFRDDDLLYFNGLFGDIGSELGYRPNTDLAVTPVIDASTSSEYVRRSYERRREALSALDGTRTGEWSADLIDSPEALEQLQSLASDGDAQACLRVAQVALSRQLGGPDNELALRWARAAAQRGLRAGMKLTISLLQQVDGDPSMRRELRAWRAAYAVRAQRRARQDRAELQRQLDQLRGSTQWQLGEHLLSLARDPRRNGRSAIRGLIELWRRHQPSGHRNGPSS